MVNSAALKNGCEELIYMVTLRFLEKMRLDESTLIHHLQLPTQTNPNSVIPQASELKVQVVEIHNNSSKKPSRFILM